jgi:hypothetical protein
MFGSTILDVAIGLVFVYLLLALICTSINELIASAARMRANTLSNGISHLLGGQALSGDTSFLEAFHDHPLISAITQQAGGHPSYLAPRRFALAVMDLCTQHKAGPLTFDHLLQGIHNLPDGKLKKTLLALMQNTDQNLQIAQTRIEDWFSDSMDRVSGWFKRKMQLITVVVAVLVTVFANADTLQISNRLWLNPTVRSATVELAKARAATPKTMLTADSADRSASPVKPVAIDPPDASTGAAELQAQVRAELGDLIGWSEDFTRFNQLAVERDMGVDPAICLAGVSTAANCPEAILKAQANANTLTWHDLWSQAFLWWIGWLLHQHVVGWLLTIIAISLGAPFWFDALKGLVNLRGTGKPPRRDTQSQPASTT